MASHPILPVGPSQALVVPSGPKADVSGKGSFAGLLREAVTQTSQLQHEADALVAQVARGNSGDLAATMIAIEKAQISFQLMLQVRNKVVEAYQEIMRMPV
jgi:flagellar hook-basal body complex protein FliE